MHMMIFVPAFGGIVNAATFMTTHSLRDNLTAKGITSSLSTLSFPDIAELRSMVTTIWYDTMPTSEYMLFIDSDMGFAPEVVNDMLLFGEPLVGAIYRQRKEPVSWAGSGTGQPNAERRGGFMEVEGVGMGCTLFKREVITAILQKYPELSDDRIDLHPAVGIIRGSGANRLIRAFEKMDAPERGIISEDLSFCIRWRNCGGRVWAAVDKKISHVGMFDFEGCYLDHLMQQNQQAQMQQAQQAAIADMHAKAAQWDALQMVQANVPQLQPMQVQMPVGQVLTDLGPLDDAQPYTAYDKPVRTRRGRSRNGGGIAAE